MAQQPADANTQDEQPALPAWRSPMALVVFFLCAAALLAADLALKDWSFRNVADRPVILDPARPGEFDVPQSKPWTVLPHTLSLRLSANTGAVFGLGKGNQSVLTLVNIVAGAIILGVFLQGAAQAWPTHVALAMVLAGAMGNLYDRIRFNAVRDMLWLFPDVKLPFGWNWPGGNDEVYPWLFNIADAALVVGVALLLIIMWLADRRLKASRSSAETDHD